MTFLCNTCKMKFNDRSELLSHYKSDIHKTNLILQSNKQPILTQDQYDDFKKKEKEEQERKKEELKGRKGKRAARERAKLGIQEEEEEEIDEDSNDSDFDVNDCHEIPETECLFCGKTFETSELTLEHMKTHGFRIPYEDKLTDRDGLMKYLSEKIGIGNCCICCSKQFKSITAVRDHMHGKSHCAFEFDDEVEDFYQENTGIVPIIYTIDENGEMHLPNGKIIGHKMYQRYYKQRHREPEDIMKGRRVAIEGPKKPRESISIDKDKKLQTREFFKQKYISKRERRLVSKDYHPFSDIHRGNA